jgi:hypothetical protein
VVEVRTAVLTEVAEKYSLIVAAVARAVAITAAVTGATAKAAAQAAATATGHFACRVYATGGPPCPL